MIHILLPIIVLLCLLVSCTQPKDKKVFWPKAQSIYSENGDKFRVERVSPDTISFEMKGVSDEITFFWDSGKMIKRNDTILFKLTSGLIFSPIFILNIALGDSIISNHYVNVNVGKAIGIQNKNLIYPDTISFMFRKIVERNIGPKGKDLFVFEGWSPVMKTDKCHFIIDSEEGIIGIWFINCDQVIGSGYCIPKVGLGYYPPTSPYILIPKSFR